MLSLQHLPETALVGPKSDKARAHQGSQHLKEALSLPRSNFAATAGGTRQVRIGLTLLWTEHFPDSGHKSHLPAPSLLTQRVVHTEGSRAS